MTNNQKLIFLILGIIAILIVGLPSLLILTIKKAKDCDQFVIDSYEVLSGIDIPKQIGSQCFYIEGERLRLGIYTLTAPHDFIATYQLREVKIGDQEQALWSQHLLAVNSTPLPQAIHTLYQVQGEKKGDKWQCIVEKNTGKMWFEVKWKE